MMCPKCGNIIPNGSACKCCGYMLPGKTGTDISFAEKAVASYVLGKIAMKQLDHVGIFDKLTTNPYAQPYVRRKSQKEKEK